MTIVFACGGAEVGSSFSAIEFGGSTPLTSTGKNDHHGNLTLILKGLQS